MIKHSLLNNNNQFGRCFQEGPSGSSGQLHGPHNRQAQARWLLKPSPCASPTSHNSCTNLQRLPSVLHCFTNLGSRSAALLKLLVRLFSPPEVSETEDRCVSILLLHLNAHVGILTSPTAPTCMMHDCSCRGTYHPTDLIV